MSPETRALIVRQLAEALAEAWRRRQRERDDDWPEATDARPPGAVVEAGR